jgi:hypothetical protein
MADIYCGNNALHPDIVDGIKIIGTRYQCLRKGIGRGFNLPLDPDYGGDYEPIDDRRMYCGNSNRLPNGYDIMGSPSKCLQKGVGIGKLKRFEEDSDEEFDGSLNINLKNTKNKYLLFFVIDIIIFLIMYITKPSYITYKDVDKNNITKINWKLFVFYYFFYLLCIFLIFKLFKLL